MPTGLLATSDALREFQAVTSTMRQSAAWQQSTDDERAPIADFETQLLGGFEDLAARRRVLESSGLLTPDGIRAQLQPAMAQLERRIQPFEYETQRRSVTLEETRGRIERGEQVRIADGTFETVTRREPTPVSEVRAGEIRRELRALSRSERHDLIIHAFLVGDQEVLDAVEGAPKSLPVADAHTLNQLVRLRMDRSGWRDRYEVGTAIVNLRRRLGEKARQALAR